MFDRLELLIGTENLEKIKKVNVVVLGLGGVGGYIVESLIRSGIENITIIDKDKIDITNLNRQIISTLDNIGFYKTDEFEKRILSINKNVKIIKITDFINEDNIDNIFTEKIDYFIDACDTVNTKKLVIDRCLKNNIKSITCLGAGKRLDPTKIKICDLRKTSYDPIAKVLRKYIKDENIKEKIICCYSEEIPLDIKSNVIASNSFVPASAGLITASYVINDICKN